MELIPLFNTVVVLALAVASVLALVVVVRDDGLARADRFSIASRLAFGSYNTRMSIARGLRSRSIAYCVSLVVAGVVGMLLVTTPLASSPWLMLSVLGIALVAHAVGSVIAGVRESIFHPTPDAPRVARLRHLRTADYLGRARTVVPWVLAAGGVIAIGVLLVVAARLPDRVDAGVAWAALATAAAATLVLAASPWLERLVLAQPQPASDTWELAWDDALRLQTLSAIALAGAISAWFTIALAVVAISGTSTGLIAQLPVLGLLVLQTAVYPRGGRRLPTLLQPASAPAGGNA